VPKGRRGHTALVYRNSMIIYGGYRDLKGSTNEMWAFHFGNFKIYEL
jgi:leucine-zipper-like transcriptional regulator 1